MKRPDRKDYINKATKVKLIADLELYIDYLEGKTRENKIPVKPFVNIPNKLITDTEGNEHWISPSISTDAVVTVKDKVLIIKRSTAMSNPNLWCLPCGFMDFNETPLLACIRELYEETGIDVREEIIINSDFQRPHALNGTALQFYFELIEYPRLTIDTDECVEYKWVGLDDLHSLDFAFGHDYLIRYFLLRRVDLV